MLRKLILNTESLGGRFFFGFNFQNEILNQVNFSSKSSCAIDGVNTEGRRGRHEQYPWNGRPGMIFSDTSESLPTSRPRKSSEYHFFVVASWCRRGWNLEVMFRFRDDSS